MNNEIECRQIVPDDQLLRQIAALYVECFNAPGKGENWTKQSSLDYFQDRIAEGSLFYIALDNTNVVGVICGSDFQSSYIANELELACKNCFYISLVAVNKDYRRAGIADRLMDVCEQDLKKRNFKTVSARCRSDNFPVQSLFEKFGFTQELKYEATLGGVTCERLLLKKPIA